ncbi:putative nucleoporin [Triangularia verruculosa]|uniref:Nucleoporin n=1 Tax=Triangularia verruculosa TaxID=2587418 RepID=A0AAN6XK89_9PEZI|nr:putative nucleoporin [Triangularia verruculosa]
MAFSFGNASNAMMGASAGGVGGLTQGSDLEVIQTEGLGFLSIAGDAKVQLTSKWQPAPAPTASLLSIAPRKGLVAAASPDAVHIATTESVRKAFEAPKDGDSDVRPFTPQAKVPLPIRISQLAFTVDEQFLILSAETGGGLAVYNTDALTQGGTQSAFEIPTNSESLRALVPNPSPDLSHFVAIVTDKGNLLMANLTEKKLVSGANGPILRAQVSCVSWSTKGKQLVAGMADGSIYQMTPEGVEKAHIPKSPNVGEYHVASLAWIENHVFLAVYNQTNGQDPSVFNLITRHQPPGGGTPTFTYQKITDPVEPFVADKTPHHTILRLKDFPPNLDELLLVASTANEGIGLLTRSKVPLAQDQDADKITNVFTTTEFADDSKRAQLPMGEDLTDTFPIGATIDLSSKDKVFKPIPTDEIENSPGPLPGLWVLNNEGVLVSWWVVYNESIRSGTTYPGIVTGSATQAITPAATASSGVSAFGSPALASPGVGAFGKPAVTAPAFGATSSPASAFGGSSALGAKPSPWAAGSAASASPTFGQSSFGSKPAAAAPSFGAPTFGQPAAPAAFGQSSLLGMGAAKPSPWATGTTASAAPAFGQTGLGSSGSTAGKVFGGGAAPSGGGFASFASKGGFGSLGGASSGSSIFASKPAAPAPEVSMDTPTAFPPPAVKTDKPAFGSSPFVLGSTFKADTSSAASDFETKKPEVGSMFGSGFSSALEAPASKDEDMDRVTPAPEEKPKSVFGDLGSTTPTSTPAPSKFGFQTAGAEAAKTTLFAPKPSAPTSSIFGTPGPASSGLFKPKPETDLFGQPKPAAKPFGAPKPAVANPFGAPKPADNPFASPRIKQEEDGKENLSSVPAVPLPPDATSKADFSFSSLSSGSHNSQEADTKAPVEADEAPLPPDFLKPSPSSKETSKSPGFSESDSGRLPPNLLSNKPKPEVYDAKPPTPEEAPLPPDFLGKPATKLLDVPAVPDSPEESEESDGDVEDHTQELGEGEIDEDEEEYDEEEESEGSGVDVTKEFSPTAGGFESHTPGITPHGSFDGGMTGSAFSTISRSEANQGRPLFGEINSKNAPLFPKPVPTSPRSPSPMRGPPRASLLRPGPPDTPRAIAPGVASDLLGRRSAPPAASPFSAAPERRWKPDVDPNIKAQMELAAKREEEAKQALVDPEDEGVQQLLHAPIEPTLQIDEFLAADKRPFPKEWENRGQKRGENEIPIACEALWGDINRMIDRLGLNSRSLQSFILGHTTFRKEDGRDQDDLENPDEWVLVEAGDLGRIIDNQLSRRLEDGRIQEIDRVEDEISGLMRDLTKLRAKEEDMRRIIMAHVDPDQINVAKSLPLSAEQAAQQNELRRSFATFSGLLAEAEEALTVLKAKLASAGGGSGRGGGQPVPTVDAILRTIQKMTAMAEKRSGDVDVLENQMRRLRLGGTPARSREGSPFVTGGGPVTPTPNNRRSLLMSPGGRGESSPFAASRMGSVGPGGGNGVGTPRKKLSQFSEEEKRVLRERERKRKNVLGLLRGSLERSGGNVSRLRDDE